MGELFLKLLARIGEWHQNLSEKTEHSTSGPHKFLYFTQKYHLKDLKVGSTCKLNLAFSRIMALFVLLCTFSQDRISDTL